MQCPRLTQMSYLLLVFTLKTQKIFLGRRRLEVEDLVSSGNFPRWRQNARLSPSRCLRRQ